MSIARIPRGSVPADPLSKFLSSSLGQNLTKTLGLPIPTPLRRYVSHAPLCDSPVPLLGGATTPYLPAVADLLTERGITHHRTLDESADKLGGLILDFSAARTPRDLAALYALGSPAVRRLATNARVIVLGTDPTQLSDPLAAATQQGLDGFVRSLGKELRSGATANLVQGPEEPNAPAVRHAVEFFLSGRSAYVDGQTVRVDATAPSKNPSLDQPLRGKVAVVTGAARGIGAAIVRTLARDGATVIGVDVPTAQDALSEVMNAVRGTALALDVTAPDAGQRILTLARERHNGLDIVVHNAGITRDKLFVNMDKKQWDQVLAVNLSAIAQMNRVFLGGDAGGRLGLNHGGRIICLSSQSGIGGNRGQTNYALSKAGLIALVRTLAPRVAADQITVNAVAPGMIETEMTAAMPAVNREVARRMSSLQQGGLPIDVAEVIAWLAQPAQAAVSGQTLRVCGQNLMGA
ncbi:3-oxoacyl-ACP reductase [Granulicoccus phenolivorans]|uniref:3-oxoacyl-ACP reductase n=1 Tax=Granulicoccus phenolivorans TaxID=266854 RepID=UPI000409969E|nr:3-oxoacyl-ACP reductase [Granulicoccus phenolivorans]